MRVARRPCARARGGQIRADREPAASSIVLELGAGRGDAALDVPEPPRGSSSPQSSAIASSAGVEHDERGGRGGIGAQRLGERERVAAAREQARAPLGQLREAEDGPVGGRAAHQHAAAGRSRRRP